MATAVRLEWHCDKNQSINVIVETEEGRPDALDEIARRAVYLLNEALAAVTPTTEETT